MRWAALLRGLVVIAVIAVQQSNSATFLTKFRIGRFCPHIRRETPADFAATSSSSFSTPGYAHSSCPCPIAPGRPERTSPVSPINPEAVSLKVEHTKLQNA